MSEAVTYEGEMSFADAVAAAAAHRNAQTFTVQPDSPPVTTESSAPSDLPVEPPPTEAQPAAPVAVDNTFKGELDALRAEVQALKAEKAAQREPEAPSHLEYEAVELDFETHFAVDPAGAIVSLAKKLNTDPKTLAEDLWYEGLGDKAPEGYRARREGKRGQLAAKTIEYRQAQERKQAEEAYLNRQAEEAEARYIGQLKSFASGAPADKLPLTSKLYAENPDMVLRGMWSHAAQLSAAGQSIASPQDAAAALEKELQTLAKIFAPAPAPVAPPAPPPVAAPAAPPSTLRNQHSQVQPSKGEVDELDDDFLRQVALKALDEQRRREGLI